MANKQYCDNYSRTIYNVVHPEKRSVCVTREVERESRKHRKKESQARKGKKRKRECIQDIARITNDK